jgi:hypothetical protein
MPARFEGDADALRFQVEWTVQQVLSARRRVAAEREAEGDSLRRDGDTAAAHEAYAAAREQYRAARDLTREFRSGSVAAFEDELTRLASKLGERSRRDADPSAASAH